jgi:hypothetical protein
MALEELHEARIKWQDSLHIVVIPHLLAPECHRQLHKVSDLVFTVPASQLFFPLSMLKPLVIGLIFPFARSAPWHLRGTPKMITIDEEEVAARDLLHQHLLEGWWFPACHQMWCGACYTTKNELGFHIISKLMEEEKQVANANPQDWPRLLKNWGRKAKSAEIFLNAHDADCISMPLSATCASFGSRRKRSLWTLETRNTSY